MSPKLLAGVVLLALAAAPARAERPPVKVYTASDGLPGDRVTSVLGDRRGYLWIATGDALRRFDGHQFVLYDATSGLPARGVEDLLEAGDGSLWVATDAGACRFEEEGPHRFSCVPAPGSGAVHALAEGPGGDILAAGDTGVFVVAAGPRPAMRSVAMVPEGVADVVSDRAGGLWLGGNGWLERRDAAGRAVRFTDDPGPHGLREGRDGRLWAITHVGLCLLDPAAPGGGSACRAQYTKRDGLPSDWINDVLDAGDGTLWVATSDGLARLRVEPAQASARVAVYGPAQGLSDRALFSLAEDRDGNVWVGSESGGLMRIVADGLTAFGKEDGLLDTSIASIFEDSAGHLYTALGRLPLPELGIHRFHGSGFVHVPGTAPRGDPRELLGLEPDPLRRPRRFGSDGERPNPSPCP